jgi:hypothetical protein
MTENQNAYAELTRRIAALEQSGGGTLELPDGVYGVDRTLRLPRTVSLCMTPNAIIRALPGFVGEAVVLKTATDKNRELHKRAGWIRGGIIDGGKLPVTGLKIEGGSRLEVSELEVLNALQKGIHANGWYEINMHNIRCNVDLDVKCPPGSIGLHMENADSVVHTMMIIGYEVGVRSDGGSNDFNSIHVWNYDPTHGPMNYCFYCNGTGDSYFQCYADSPCLAGFYVCKPFQRIFASRTFYSRFQTDRAGVGVLITPEGFRGTYMGNFYYAVAECTLDKAYDGHLEDATILGDVYPCGVVHGGKECRIPSQNGELNQYPQVHVVGPSLRLDAKSAPPTPTEGQIGDLAWLDEPGNEAVFVKTSRGWLRARLSDVSDGK